jgi:hypothetical protein
MLTRNGAIQPINEEIGRMTKENSITFLRSETVGKILIDVVRQ